MNDVTIAAALLILGGLLANIAQTCFGLTRLAKTKNEPGLYALFAIIFGSVFALGSLVAVTGAVHLIRGS